MHVTLSQMFLVLFRLAMISWYIAVVEWPSVVTLHKNMYDSPGSGSGSGSESGYVKEIIPNSFRTEPKRKKKKKIRKKKK